MVGYHEPVLLKEVLDGFRVSSDGWYVDCTLGDGGHSLEVIRQGGNIIGIDVDPKALERVEKRFEEEEIGKSRFNLVLGNFRELENLIYKQAEPSKKIKGIVFDLGVSSQQLEDPARGFSFGKNGPLDMRMDPSLGVTAADLIKVLRKDELNELFSKLGEEKRSFSMASAVDSARSVSSTTELAQILERASGGRREKIHPATRVFQALRIAVNDELNALKEALPQALKVVQNNGHILVISFHSLEDRIVKNTFREWENSGFGVVVTKKPIVPSDQEVVSNPRSRSAKLRIFEKQ